MPVCNGKLARFRECPIDIVLEIAANLHPAELLAFSRVSKRMRSLLLSRRHRDVWTSSLALIPDLPSCPDDLSEPAYVALLFDGTCLLCGVNRSTRVDYALRLRLCKSCYQTNVKKGSRILEDIERGSWWNHFFLELVPCEIGIRDDLDHVRSKETPSEHYPKDRYYVPSVINIIEDYDNIPDADRESFKKERRALVTQRHMHTTELILWHRSVEANDRLDALQVMKVRAYSIYEKLLKAGYPLSDLPNTDAWNKLVLQPKALTDRTWTNLLPKLEVLITEERERQAKVAHEQRVTQRMAQVAYFYEYFLKEAVPPAARELMPNVRDVGLLPSLKALAMEGDIQSDVTPQAFLTIAHQMIAEVEDYKVRVKDALLEQLRRSREDTPEDIENLPPDVALERHYAIFGCSGCKIVPVPYPAIHAHWRTAHPDKTWFPDPSDYKERTRVFHFGERALGDKILDGVGLPRDTPQSTLNALIHPGRLYCSCGDPSLSPPPRLSWGELYQHVMMEVLAYDFRNELLRPDLPKRNLVFKRSHSLAAGPDCCVKYIPAPDDPSPGAVRVTISSELRAKVQARLAERPQAEPLAIALCRQCERLTRRTYRPDCDRYLKLPETPEGIVWHLRTWHEKEFEPGDVRFVVDDLYRYLPLL